MSSSTGDSKSLESARQTTVSPLKHLEREPRLLPALLPRLREIGMSRSREPRSMKTLPNPPSTIDLAVLMSEIEMGFESLCESAPNDLPSDEFELPTKREDRSIQGADGQDMLLHIYRPVLGTSPSPCIVYFHGGGMVVLRTLTKSFDRWCQSLAAAGIVVVNVDYRNAYSPAAYYPFPTGLNDCAAAIHYLHAFRDQLDIRNIVLHGEGGGGNLALALALKANREGWVHKIDGVFAIDPCISNAYDFSISGKPDILRSLADNNGYVLSTSMLAHMATFYTPRGEDQTNPLAWPYHARVEDMQGLPPHVIVVDELDPLRDEGIGYARHLAGAGVQCTSKINVGTIHACAVMCRKDLPALNLSTVSDVAAFVKRA